MAKRTNVLAIEIAGTTFIIFLGSALHFTYALSGNNPLVGSFSAVNESVWEHLKLAFFPSLFWMIISMFPLRNTISNFFTSKTVGAYIMVILIPIVFYLYTAFTGESIFLIDISTFVAAVIIGQFASYRLFRHSEPSKLAEKVSVIAVIVLAVVFIVFTFYPPHLPLFQDPISGQYGV